MYPLLEGYRVVDFTRLIPGAGTTMYLADYGADVIKVERPPVGDYLRVIPPRHGELGYFHLLMNRNKRSLAVDDRNPEGRKVIEKLIKSADVFVESNRPGSMDAEGWGYKDVKQINPQIVYCSISGFGQDGPYASVASHGLNIDSLAGVLAVERDGGKPTISEAYLSVGTIWGAVFAAMSIAFGLLRRAKRGEGCYIDASCWDAAIQYDFRHIIYYANKGEGWPPYSKLGSRYDVYRTKDDRELMLCPIEKKFWDNFCDAVGRPDLKEFTDQKGQVEFGDRGLTETLKDIVASKTMDEWLQLVLEKDVPATPVYKRGEILDDPHFKARKRLIEHQHPQDGKVMLITPPVKLPGSEFDIRRPAPALGEHNGELLRELGYTPEGVVALREAKAIPA